MYCRPDHRDVGDFFDELLIDNFAGGGGASLGIEQGTGRAVDIAINHDRLAVAMHRINHPATHHLTQDVWSVDPVELCAGRRVGLLWLSPDCTFHSKARGGKPIRNAQTKSRDLAWVTLRWAAGPRPRLIILENVEEFRDWGPLTRKRGRLKHPRPCRFRKGRTFERFVNQLKALGYDVEFREIRACDYGSPTIRKRLFLIARCDGNPIVWPEVTHGPHSVVDRPSEEQGNLQSEMLAAAGGKHDKGRGGHHRQSKTGREGARPENRRFVRGGSVVRDPTQSTVIGAGRAFDEAGTGGNGQASRDCRQGMHAAARQPLRPYRTAADCIDFGIPCPSIFERRKPLAKKTQQRIANGIRKFVLECPQPFLIQFSHAGTTGRGKYVWTADEPLRTLSTTNEFGVVAPILAQYNGEAPHQSTRGQGVDRPMTTVATAPRHALVAAFLSKHYGGVVGSPIQKPIGTVTATDHHSLTAAHLVKMRGTSKHGQRLDEPMHTVTGGGNHAALVAALMAPYYGSGSGRSGRDLREPAPTITTKDRLQLVTVTIDGETYVIVDIGMRMLQPRELFRAQGFPDNYIIDRGIDESGETIKLTKTAQVKMCGNSVCPQVVAALVRANVPNLESAECAA